MEVTLACSEGHIQKILALPSVCHDAPWDLEEVIWASASSHV